jgi:tetratricopeptide (TPR) repeat protein
MKTLKYIAYLFTLPAIALLLLAGTEFALRLAGVGGDTRYLRTVEVGQKSCQAPNKRFFNQFSTLPIDTIVDWDDMDFRAAVPKPKDTYRIVILGESAAQGGHWGFARYLNAMLRLQAPEAAVEILNLACPGSNSSVMQEVARSAETLQPGLFLVYLGNNEGVPPYSAEQFPWDHESLARPRYIHAHTLLLGLRLTQACGRLLGGIQSQNPTQFTWRTGQTNAPRIHALFARNLAAICDAAQHCGAHTLLCTLARNQRSGYLNKPAVELPAQARQRYPLNDTILQEARNRAAAAVTLVDLEEAFRASAPDGVSGYESFNDPVHFTFEGSYLAAKNLYPRVLENLTRFHPNLPANPADIPSQEACEAFLGITPALKAEQYCIGNSANRDSIPEEDLAKELQCDRLKPLLKPAEDDAVLEGYRAAIRQSGGDYRLRLDYATRLMRNAPSGELDEAVKALRTHFPDSRAGLRLSALNEYRKKNIDAAVKAFQELLSRYPDDTVTLRTLGDIALARKHGKEACHYYDQTLFWNPRDFLALFAEADALEHLGRTNDARNIYQKILRLNPNDQRANDRLQHLSKH